jgi:hypothetical protein
MIAYEWDTTVEASTIRVDPRLNGQQVRVVVMLPQATADPLAADSASQDDAIRQLLALAPMPAPQGIATTRDERHRQ